MNAESAQPAPDAERPLNRQGDRSLPPAGLVLALGWLLLPAMQYFGTYQRTLLQVEGRAPMEALAALDLTLGYIVLFIATAVYAALRVIRR